MKFVISYAIILMLCQPKCFSQKGMTLAGIQLKPIFPLNFVGTGKITNYEDGVSFETLLKSGFNAGVVIRYNFTDLLAIETGINYVKRTYSLTIRENDFEGKSSFRIVSYEIPAVLMVYAQMSEKIYINGSMGPTIDLFPSSIQTTDYYFNNVGFRNHIVLPAVTANLGFEYRTNSSGIIYLGASFQRPFSNIYFSKIGYYNNQKTVIVQNDLEGSYLTIDLRYFFPQTEPKNIEH
jgi:hypothetical protein